MRKFISKTLQAAEEGVWWPVEDFVSEFRQVARESRAVKICWKALAVIAIFILVILPALTFGGQAIQSAIQPKVVASYKVTVNYGLSLEEMIQLGNYDWVDPKITAERFPIEGYGVQEITIEILSMSPYLKLFNTSDGILAAIDQLGYRPVNIAELLALGAAKPEFQHEFLIPALDSRWWNPRGGYFFAYLDGGNSGCGLSLDRFGIKFGNYWYFAVIRKTPNS